MVILNSSYYDYRKLYIEEYDFFNGHLQYMNAVHYPVTRQITERDFIDYTAEYVILMIMRFCKDVLSRTLPREYITYSNDGLDLIFGLNRSLMTEEEISKFEDVLRMVSKDDWSPKVGNNVYNIKYTKDRRDFDGRGKTPPRHFIRPNHQGYGESKWKSTDFT